MLAAGADVEGCAIGLAEKHKPICIYEMMGRIASKQVAARCRDFARRSKSSSRCTLLTR